MATHSPYPVSPAITYRQTMTDVTIPLAQAVITGFLVACVAVTVAVTVAIRSRWSFLIPCGVWFGCFSITTTVQWLRLTTPKKPAPVFYPAPATPEPTPEEPELRIVCLTKAPGNTNPEQAEPGDVQETFGLHIRPDTLRAIIRSCESGAHQWSYRSLADIPGVSETVAVRLLDELLESGLLAYRNGQKNHPRGHELTAAGRALARKLSS